MPNPIRQFLSQFGDYLINLQDVIRLLLTNEQASEVQFLPLHEKQKPHLANQVSTIFDAIPFVILLANQYAATH